MRVTIHKTVDIEVDIGKPPGECAVWGPAYQDAPLTWWWLRRIGFRFAQAGVDTQPHMIAPVDHQMDTALEIAPSHYRDGNSWTVWLRSDLAHSRCRFCFVRNVTKVAQLVALMEAISGMPVPAVDFDTDQFAESLMLEWRECHRRYREYANDARWGRVPGGM